MKLELVAFAGIVSDPGTETAELPLDRLTISPPVGAAAVNFTVQESVPAPVMELLLHERLLSAAAAFS